MDVCWQNPQAGPSNGHSPEFDAADRNRARQLPNSGIALPFETAADV
jgi:hypothetical protein